MEQYQKEYKEFIDGYSREVVDAEGVGELICRMAQYFSETNTSLSSLESRLNQLAATTIKQTDENSGKPISAAKADVLVKASEEYRNYAIAKGHLENISQMINSLKSLLRGLTNEFSYASHA